MAKFHINSKGEPGLCQAQKSCPFGGEASHYATAEEARQAFEASQDAFAVVISHSKKSQETRQVVTQDATLATALTVAAQEYGEADSKQDWIEDKTVAVARAQERVMMTAADSAAREKALQQKANARTALLAAQLTTWRNSPFYDERVEESMKASAVVISEADTALEAALNDEKAQEEVAQHSGLAKTDVRRILEIAQEEYLRPTSPRNQPLATLATDDNYAMRTAHVFRIEKPQVQKVINFASSYSA